MKIILIDKDFVEEHLSDLIYLNREQVDERMHWADDNFLSDYDEKWEVSIAAVKNEKILGYIFGTRKGGNAHINLLMVDSKNRSSQVGCYLLEQFQGHVKSKGYDKMSLWVYSDLLGVQRFYEKFGFIKKRNRINDKGENLSKFEKEVN
jgi:ribosomal protein S18 acetylase RimI-like enzyme